MLVREIARAHDSRKVFPKLPSIHMAGSLLQLPFVLYFSVETILHFQRKRVGIESLEIPKQFKLAMNRHRTHAIKEFFLSIAYPQLAIIQTD